MFVTSPPLSTDLASPFLQVLGVHEVFLHDPSPSALLLAKKYYDTLVQLTLAPRYYVESEGLLVKGNPAWQQKWFPNSTCASCEPDLVDSPPKYMENFFSPNNRSIVTNLYSARALDALAEIADALAKQASGEDRQHGVGASVGNYAVDAKKFAAMANKIRAAVKTRMFNLNHDGLFVDGDKSNHSALSSQYFSMAHGMFDSTNNATRSDTADREGASGGIIDKTIDPMPLLAFIRNETHPSVDTSTTAESHQADGRTAIEHMDEHAPSLPKPPQEPTCSCMGGHWLLEGLYRVGRTVTAVPSTAAADTIAAGDTDDGVHTAASIASDPGSAAAQLAWDFLVSDNTWRLMINAGATTTMEVWTVSDKPNLSWSHPWCSAPANAIPRYLMGILPIAQGWSRAAVRPQPPTSLQWATISVPVPSASALGTARNVPVMSAPVSLNEACFLVSMLLIQTSSDLPDAAGAVNRSPCEPDGARNLPRYTRNPCSSGSNEGVLASPLSEIHCWGVCLTSCSLVGCAHDRWQGCRNGVRRAVALRSGRPLARQL
jgi:hypothetical protein